MHNQKGPLIYPLIYHQLVDTRVDTNVSIGYISIKLDMSPLVTKLATLDTSTPLEGVAGSHIPRHIHPRYITMIQNEDEQVKPLDTSTRYITMDMTSPAKKNHTQCWFG